jgi:hypothetical protein
MKLSHAWTSPQTFPQPSLRAVLCLRHHVGFANESLRRNKPLRGVLSRRARADAPLSPRDKGTLRCTRRGVKRSRRAGDEGIAHIPLGRAPLCTD